MIILDHNLLEDSSNSFPQTKSSWTTNSMKVSFNLFKWASPIPSVKVKQIIQTVGKFPVGLVSIGMLETYPNRSTDRLGPVPKGQHK